MEKIENLKRELRNAQEEWRILVENKAYQVGLDKETFGDGDLRYVTEFGNFSGPLSGARALAHLVGQLEIRICLHQIGEINEGSIRWRKPDPVWTVTATDKQRHYEVSSPISAVERYAEVEDISEEVQTITLQRQPNARWSVKIQDACGWRVMGITAPNIVAAIEAAEHLGFDVLGVLLCEDTQIPIIR